MSGLDEVWMTMHLADCRADGPLWVIRNGAFGRTPAHPDARYAPQSTAFSSRKSPDRYFLSLLPSRKGRALNFRRISVLGVYRSRCLKRSSS